MSISVGDSLPDISLIKMGESGPEAVALSSLTAGRKVAIFGLPGAFTGTCTSAHLPSFIRTRAAMAEKGVDEVICISVNDPFVMDAWDKSTGASDGGITMLSDPASEYAKGTGLNFTAPPVGFFDRLKRHALYAEDGTVKVFNIDENPGVCELSAGETLLEAL